MPLATARSIFSLGMFAAFARPMTEARVGEAMFPAAFFDSMVISRANLENARLFAASVTAFPRFICAHLLCPAIV
jgi:hypothetical protein